MSKAIARFFHILDSHSKDQAIESILQHQDTDFNNKEATKLMTILAKATRGEKVKTSETDFLSEYGAELNQIFPPLTASVNTSKVDTESTESIARLKKELFDTNTKLDDQVKKNALLIKKNTSSLASDQEKISLTMQDGTEVSFVKIEVPADKIESITKVPFENGRLQEWLNEFNLADLLEDFHNDIAQVHPGLGYGSLTTAINVLDGSRRRMARILFNNSVEANKRKPYNVYIPLDPTYVLSPVDAMFISGTAKKQKELSSVETGFRYHKLTQGEEGIEQKELATLEQVSPSLVSELKRVVDIPKEWLDAFPDIYKITDSHIKRLYKIAKSLPKDEHTAITSQLLTAKESLLKYERNIARITTELVKLTEGMLRSSVPVSKTTENKAQSLWSNGKSKITLSKANDSKGTCTLKLAKLPDALRESLVDEIAELIAKRTREFSSN